MIPSNLNLHIDLSCNFYFLKVKIVIDNKCGTGCNSGVVERTIHSGIECLVIVG
jgi:hypothetical protein